MDAFPQLRPDQTEIEKKDAIDELFRLADMNNDGYLCKREFVRFCLLFYYAGSHGYNENCDSPEQELKRDILNQCIDNSI